MYGSSFMFATLRPRFSMSAPIDAETMPLPRDETTPPVTNTNLVCCAMETIPRWRDNRAPAAFYRLHTVRAIAEARPRGDLRNSTVIRDRGGRFIVDRRRRWRMLEDPTPRKRPPSGDPGSRRAQ